MHAGSEKHLVWPGQEVAHSNLERLETFLDKFGEVLAEEYGPVAALERVDTGLTARNTYDVSYVLRSSGDTQLSLNFIVTGEKADLILFGSCKSAHSPPEDDPSQIEQHVFRLDEIDTLKTAVEEKIATHILGENRRSCREMSHFNADVIQSPPVVVGSPEMSTSANQSMIVLLVEEETHERMFIIEHLSTGGYEPVGVETTDDALTLLESRSDVQAVITDAHVPGKIDGWELAHETRRRWPEIAVVLMSGHSDPSSGPIPDGAEFVSKPYLPEDLLPTLQRMMAA